MKVLVNMKQQDSILLYIDSPIGYTINDIKKISNLIKTLDCNIDTMAISDLGVKEFLILILFCNRKREISDDCKINLHKEKEIDEIGTKVVADLITDAEINYSRNKFMKDYENNVTLDFKKLKSIFNLSDIRSTKSDSAKQATKRKRQAIPISAVNGSKNIDKVVTTKSDDEKPVSDEELAKINNVDTDPEINSGKELSIKK